MKYIGKIWMLALPLLLAGCAKDELGGGTQTGSGEIAFEVGFAPTAQTGTRVATDAGFNSTWEDRDLIGIFAVRSGTPLSSTASENHIHNVALIYNANTNTWTPSTPLYWPQDGTALDFYAYYPYDATFNPAAAEYNVMLDQSGETDGQSDFNVNDWLTAKSNNNGAGYAKGATTVPLSFSHAMAMIQTTLDNETGLLDTSGEITVTLKDVQRMFGLNLATGETEVLGTKSDIKMYRVEQPGTPEYATTYTYRALLPAEQTFEAGTSLMRITDGTTTLLSTPLAEPLTLIAGQAEKFGQQMPEVPVDKTALNNRITWDAAANNGNGGYALTTDPRDAGLYFMFGSVVGVFSGNGELATLPTGANSDPFDEGDVAWSPVAVTGWGDDPSVDVSHTVANVKEGKGDPCRLVGLDLAAIKSADAGSLTPSDIDNGVWRLPTYYENIEFVGTYNSPTDWQTLDGVNGHQFPDDDTFLPAAGYRDFSDGSVSNQGTDGHYWSSTASGSNGGFLGFGRVYVSTLNGTFPAYGFGVRCVRQD